MLKLTSTFNDMKKFYLWVSATICLMMSACAQNGSNGIVGVKSYGFFDLEGAKVSAIIVEIEPSSITTMQGAFTA